MKPEEVSHFSSWLSVLSDVSTIDFWNVLVEV